MHKTIAKHDKYHPYTLISNQKILNNTKLSDAAVGALSRILSHGEKWDLNVQGYSSYYHCGTQATRRVFRELEQQGYLHRKPECRTNGRFGKDRYEVFEDPGDNPHFNGRATTAAGNPKRSNRDCSTVTENDTEYNIDVLNIDINTTSETPVKNQKPPTLAAIKKYFLSIESSKDPEAFWSHYEAKGWINSGGHPINWKRKAKEWCQRPFSPDNKKITRGNQDRHSNTNFNDFRQRMYDYAEIEKKLFEKTNESK